MKTKMLLFIIILFLCFLFFIGNCMTSVSYHTLKVTLSPEGSKGYGTIVAYPAPENIVLNEITLEWEGDYPDGTIVKLTGKGLLGWIFDYWEGDLSGYTNPIDIVMDGDKTVTAVLTDGLGDIVGIWENSDYNSDDANWAKLDWHPSGNFNAYYNTTDTELESCWFLSKYWKKWTDPSNAVFYKVEVSSLCFGYDFWYLLVKISVDRNTMEMMINFTNVPEFLTTIDPGDSYFRYRTYSR